MPLDIRWSDQILKKTYHYRRSQQTSTETGGPVQVVFDGLRLESAENMEELIINSSMAEN